VCTHNTVCVHGFPVVDEEGDADLVGFSVRSLPLAQGHNLKLDGQKEAGRGEKQSDGQEEK